MPALASLSLLSSAASGLIQAAGHVADALGGAKSTSDKKSNSPNQAQNASQLANLFAAYLTAAAHTATGQAASSTTTSNVPQNGSVKSVKDASGSLVPLSLVLAMGPTTAISASMALHPALAGPVAGPKNSQTPALVSAATSKVPAMASGLPPAAKQTSAPAAKTPTPAKATPNAPAASVGDRNASASAKGTLKGLSSGQRASNASPPGATPTGQGAAPALHQATTTEAPVLALHDVPVSTTYDNSPTAAVSKTSVSESRAVATSVPSSRQVDDVGNESAAVLTVSKLTPTVPVAHTKFAGWSESSKSTSSDKVDPKNATSSTSSTGSGSGPQPASPQLASTSIVTVAAPIGQVAGNTAASGSNNPQTNTPLAEQLSRALVSQASVVNHEGRTDFHLRLQPPQLGSVQIHLTATHDKVSARVIVAHEETRQLIVGQAHQLRQSLAESGLVLGTFDVSRDGGGSSQGGHQQPPEMPQPPTASGASPTVAAVVKAPPSIPTDGIDILA